MRLFGFCKFVCQLKGQDNAGIAVVQILKRQFSPPHRRIIDIIMFALFPLPDDKMIKIPMDNAGNGQSQKTIQSLAVAVNL